MKTKTKINLQMTKKQLEKNIGKKIGLLGLCVALLSPVGNVYAAENTNHIANSTTNDDLEQSVDSFMQDKMKEYQIPGAAVVVVEDGKVVLEKGYGKSNVEENKDFSRDTTFRIASITKTFTATALLQLIEEGKVDKNQNILEYLPDLKLNNPYQTPVTVENLLNYTSGLDSSVLLELSHEEMEMPCGYLLQEMNKKDLTVVTEPGTRIQYCSYGVVLEGCIIEAISGESCADYIANHVLTPLDMKHTAMSFMNQNMSHGYIVQNNQLREYTLTGYFKLYPEGGMISSVEDMSHYIQMFLNNGKYGDAQVLHEDTTQSMLNQSYSYDTLLPGMCYGFSEYDSQGVRLAGHGGYSSDGFLAQVDLYPQYQSGTFLVVNQGNNNITDEFRDYYIDYKEWNTQPQVALENKENTLPITGTYRFSDYSKTTLCKGDVFGGVGEVTITKRNRDTGIEGQIQLDGINEFTKEAYSYVANRMDDTHYQIEGQDKYVVFLTENGKVTGMAMTDDSWHGYYDKIRWYETGKLHVSLTVAAILMYLVCSIGILGRVLLGIGIKKIRIKSAFDWKRKLTILWISFMNAGFLIYSMYRWGDRLRYEIPVDVKMNLMMPFAGMAGMLVLLVLLGKEFVHKQGKIRNRIFDVCFLIISVLYLLLLNYYNLIGFHY